MSLVFLTFGGGLPKYHEAVERILKQAQDFPFDKIIGYTEKDLQEKFPEFWSKHKNFILNNRRGYGYWIWKSFIILDTLKQLNEGDILVYLDCGCELNKKGLKRFMEYIELVKVHDRMFFHLEDEHTENRWTKMDLIRYLGIENQSFLNKSQSQGGLQFHKKIEANIKLLEEYYNICVNNYNLIDDSPSITRNHPHFREHRHDQSLISLLVKKNNYFTLRDETWPDSMPDQNNKDSYPIWALRNYSKISKLP
jgi:hypothetical protein